MKRSSVAVLAVFVTACAQEVSGRVIWDDGSPATGARVIIMSEDDQVDEAIVGNDGRYSAIVPGDAFGIAAVTRGAYTDPAYVDGDTTLRLMPISVSALSALQTCSTNRTFGVSSVLAGGDVEIRFTGTANYVYTPLWLPNLRLAGASAAERSSKYSPDPQAWDKDVKPASGGWKTMTLLIPRRYQSFVRVVYGQNLSRAVYVCGS